MGAVCEALLDSCLGENMYRKGSDNMTIIVVLLDPRLKPGQEPAVAAVAAAPAAT